MSKCHHRECLHCKEFFHAHPRNRHHQQFCFKPPCRKASKAQSQRRWLSKPENQNHFAGPANVERVRQWRKKNPLYWKRPSKASGTLQDLLTRPITSNPPEPQELALKTSGSPLQDVLPNVFSSQDPLLLGLISHLIDSPLQEIIEQTTLQLLRKGRSILDLMSGMKPKENYENQKANPLSGTAPPHSRTVQLDRSTPGP